MGWGQHGGQSVTERPFSQDFHFRDSGLGLRV